MVTNTGVNVHTRIKEDEKPFSETPKSKLRQLTKTNTFDNFRGDGETPLYFAAANNARETAELLLDHDADADARNKERDTPRDIAIRAGHLEMAQLLQ